MGLSFVTGATGFVGSHVVERLIQKGEKVRVLARPQSSLRNLMGLAVDVVRGDLNHPSSYQTALKGCDKLYHVAAQYQLWIPDPKAVYATNVQGSIQLMHAARHSVVKRIVYTSTVGVLGIPKDGGRGHEETPVSLRDMISHYKRSKFLAEEEIKKLVLKGFPIVIVNPSTPVGTRDSKPTPTGQMIVDFLNGKMRAYVDTGLNLVDVEDVAEGHILAAEKGRIGQRYILGNQNLPLLEIFRILSKISEIPCPRIRIPYAVALGAACVSTALSRYLTHRAPAIPWDGVRMSRKKMYFDSAKAVHELGFMQSSVEEALRKAVLWYRQNGYCKIKSGGS